MKEMLDRIPQVGRVTWISYRPAKKADVQVVSEIMVDTNQGVIGDHYHGTNGKRHLTCIQKEHIETVSSILKKEISPTLLRRNLVIEGINLHSLISRTIRIGDSVVAEVTGPCHPCSRMEENLGPGGYNAMRGHGGITCRILKNGKIGIGDLVKVANDA